MLHREQNMFFIQFYLQIQLKSHVFFNFLIFSQCLVNGPKAQKQILAVLNEIRV